MKLRYHRHESSKVFHIELYCLKIYLLSKAVHPVQDIKTLRFNAILCMYFMNM
jgi:hypothetical protein